MKIFTGALIYFITFALCYAAAIKDDGIEEFHSWFDQIGGKAPKFRVHVFTGMGKGILATKDIKKGSRVNQVPMDYVICRETIMKQPVKYRTTWKLFENHEEEDLINVFLMQQMGLGNQSTWGPYLDILPTSLVLPHMFSKDELKMIEDDMVASLAKKRRKKMKKRYKALKDRIDKVFVDIPNVEFASFKSYLWADSMMGSRALSLKGFKYLVPLSDMFNYSPENDTREADSGANFLKYHRIEDGFFKVFADRPTKKGQQAFEDYGDNQNDIYFHHHGFIAHQNPFDCVNIFIDSPAVDPLRSIRSSLIQSLNLQLPHVGCVSTTKPIEFSVVVATKLMVMNESEIEKCLAIAEQKNGQWSREEVLDCSGEISSVYPALAKLIENQLDKYSTTIEDDEQLLVSKDIAEGAALAVNFRLSRKRLLKEMVAKLQPAESGEISEAETEASLESIVVNLNNWVNAAAQDNKIKAMHVPGMRLGAVATTHLDKEDVYLSVPPKLIMDVETASKCDVLGPVFVELMEKFKQGDDYHQMLFHLMYEKFVRKETSQWAPYLDSLPSAAQTHFPIFWSSEELSELQNSASRESIAQYQIGARRKYDGLSMNIFPMFPAVFTFPEFSFENYRWATAIMDSRSIWWGSGRHLVPLLDLVNCDEEGPDPSRVHATTLDNNGDAATRADREYHIGDQIFENYGQPNYIYFMYHGFVLDRNSHDCIRVDLSLDLQDPNFQDKQQLLQTRGVRDGEVVCLEATVDILPKVFGFISVKDEVPSSDSIAIQIATVEHFQSLLDGYTTSIEEDESILAKKEELGWHLKMAVKLRLQEKKHLANLIAKINLMISKVARDEL